MLGKIKNLNDSKDFSGNGQIWYLVHLSPPKSSDQSSPLSSHLSFPDFRVRFYTFSVFAGWKSSWDEFLKVTDDCLGNCLTRVDRLFSSRHAGFAVHFHHFLLGEAHGYTQLGSPNRLGHD